MNTARRFTLSKAEWTDANFLLDHIPLVDYNITQVEYGRNENAETRHIRIVEL